MTVREALQKTQGRDAGSVNRSAVRYAETLLQADEEILSAVIANVAARREHFPGVVVLTSRRIMAVCGLPGIKRSISLERKRHLTLWKEWRKAVSSIPFWSETFCGGGRPEKKKTPAERRSVKRLPLSLRRNWAKRTLSPKRLRLVW